MANVNGNFKPTVARFGAATEEEINKIMEERGSKNTNKSVKGAIKILRQYLSEKNYAELETLNKTDLAIVLEEFYTNV